MLKKIIYSLLLFLLASCQQEFLSGEEKKAEKILVSVHLDAGQPGTKVQESTENIVEQLNVLVFHGNLLYEHIADARYSAVGGQYMAEFEITPYPGEITLWFIANLHQELLSYAFVPGTSMESVKARFSMWFGSDGLKTDYFPMYGEHVLQGADQQQHIGRVGLVRALAKVEVTLDDAVTDFECKYLFATRVNSLVQLIPETLTTGANGPRVAAPSVPLQSQKVIVTDPVSAVSSHRITGLYVPESYAAPANEASCLILAGSYQGGATSYYRLNFDSGTDQGRILRNFRYNIRITSVSGDGSTHPGEVPDYDVLTATVEIAPWEEDSFGQASDYLAVSGHQINLHFYETSSAVITVNTNLSDFTVQWCNPYGVPTGEPGAGIGEYIANADFRVRIADDGTSIRATALHDNEDNVLTHHILVSSGNINFIVDINQATRQMRDYVHIYNVTMTWGTIGDDLLNIHTTPNDPFLVYAQGLRDILREPANFGFNGTVPFAGYYISGLPHQTQLNPYLLELFDVVMIPPANSNAIDDREVENLVQWVEARKNRVLFVHHDWGWNQNLIQKLGMTTQSIRLTINSQYKISDRAPRYIKYGPFGDLVGLIGVTAPGEAGYIDQNEHPEITPVLVNAYFEDQVYIGIDMERRIIYHGDYRLHTPASFTGKVTGNGAIVNDYDVLIANLWGWIAEMVLEDEHEAVMFGGR